MIKHMTTPLTQSQALDLQAGDQVLFILPEMRHINAWWL